MLTLIMSHDLKVGKNLDAKGYGVATTKGSGLLDMVSRNIMEILVALTPFVTFTRFQGGLNDSVFI